MYKILLDAAPLVSEDVGEMLEEKAAEVGEKAVETVNWLQKITPDLIKYGKLILSAVIIFFIGKKVIKLLTKGLNKTFKKVGIESGLCTFLDSLASILLNMILIVIIAGYVGIETSSLAAVVGSAGLAIGLALQGSLSNFAGGVVILVTKPFVMGDYIITPMGEGNVEEIGIAYTRLCTVDNRIIVIPNGTLSNSSLTNVSVNKERLVDLEIGVAYDSDLKKVRDVIMGVVSKQELILKDREVLVFVKKFAASSIDMGIRFQTATENYWNAKWKFQEDLKEAFDREGIVIPFKQVDVHVLNEKAGEDELTSTQEREIVKELERSLGKEVKKELEKKKEAK